MKERAVAALEQAASRAPGDPRPFEQLDGIYREAGQTLELAALLERRAAAVTDRDQRGELYERLAASGRTIWATRPRRGTPGSRSSQ